MEIHRVTNKKDLSAFIKFPYNFYGNDPIWVPPLLNEQKKQFNPEKNPLLQHCEWRLFLLKENKEVIGRIAAFIDNLAVDFWRKRIGHFGYFECIESEEASKALLDAAFEWLKNKQCEAMRGPWSFVSQEWGSVVEGFTPSPVIMAPYNPPYYNTLYESFGLKKVKDLLCWYIAEQEGYKIPERILHLTDAVQKRYGIRIRKLDLKNYDSEIQKIVDLSNASIIDNWGFSPVTEDEVKAMADDLRPIIQPKGVLFAEDKNDKTIGFAIALPDINTLIKDFNGRLFPFGIIKLLFGIPRLRNYRMFALGVIPQYQGKAVDSLLYRALNEHLFAPDVWIEINYVLEDNWPMINAIKKLGATPLRRYRVYEIGI